jgi:hypothetical protein
MKYTKEIEMSAKQIRLINHINKINADAQKCMDANPNLWVGRLTNDPDHWADYGVYTPEDFERYLDNEAEHSQEFANLEAVRKRRTICK